jgi:hypothetical protein
MVDNQLVLIVMLHDVILAILKLNVMIVKEIDKDKEMDMI